MKKGGSFGDFGGSRSGSPPPPESRRIRLKGNEVAYVLMRCRRKTIGMRISSAGLTVRIPLTESVGWVETVLEKRAGWIVQKLAEWKDKKPAQPAWRAGGILPLLGKPWEVTLTSAGQVRMVRAEANSQAGSTQLSLSISPVITPEQIELGVMSWYRDEAMACFQERVALYANKLGVAVPQLRLSYAKTLWGSCNARGVIRLNWRLIQKPLELVDYVVAHELAHLIEMNHSRAFWQVVENIYPNYAIARKQLRHTG